MPRTRLVTAESGVMVTSASVISMRGSCLRSCICTCVICLKVQTPGAVPHSVAACQTYCTLRSILESLKSLHFQAKYVTDCPKRLAPVTKCPASGPTFPPPGIEPDHCLGVLDLA